MNGFLQVFYVIFSGIITSFAIQNEILLFGSPFLGLFALVPLYMAIASCKTFRRAGLLTALQMLITHVISSFWLVHFKDFAIFTLGGTAVVYTMWGYLWGQIFFAPFYFTQKTELSERASLGGGSNLFVWNNPIRIIMFATVWTLYEWYKSNGFLGYPWGTLIMTAWKWKIVTQIVSFTGTWGISFLFSLFSAMVAEGLILFFKIPPKNLLTKVPENEAQSQIAEVTQDTKPCRMLSINQLHPYVCTALFCLSLFGCTVVYGIYEYTKERIPIKTVNTVFVQPNTDSWLTFDDEEAIKIGQELTVEAIEAYEKTPDLILWSEAILGKAYPNAEYYYQTYPPEKPLTRFIADIGVPFIIGGPVEINQEKAKETGRRQFNNSALYYDKYGNWESFYGKIQLVPFAENMPYPDNKWVQKFMQAVVKFSSGWAQGEYYTLFDIPLADGQSAKVSVPICYEDAFPLLCRHLFFAGSEAFFNITNDAWSQTDSAEIQHFIIASYRSQEFRTTLVRSTNAGFTTVVDPAGRILYSLPLFESTSGAFDIPIYERKFTLYALLGNWLPQLLVMGFIGFYIFVYFKYLKPKKDTHSLH